MKKLMAIALFQISACFVFSATTTAQTLSEKPSSNVFEDVKLLDSVTLQDGDKKIELQSVSHGIRKKKVYLLAVVKIYVTEFLAADATKLVKNNDGILKSLKDAGAVQLRLTVSRDITGTQISESFKEALKVNGIEIDRASKELIEVLTAVGDFKKFNTGDVFSLTATWNNDTATLYIQKPNLPLQKISGPEKFVTDLFSIWFGKPADAKLEDLKKELLK
jgi:hypothetical protein